MMNVDPTKGSIIFDFNRTLFDPTVYALYHGVGPMLEELRHSKRLFLYSRKSWDRSDLLRSLGIDEYFDGVKFVEHKTAENLNELIAANEIDPNTAVIVGDMLTDELCVGQELGLKTVWFANTITESAMIDATPTCVPDHTVHSVDELRELLARL